MGPRASQTARYQAPEPRLTGQRFTDYFPFWKARQTLTQGIQYAKLAQESPLEDGSMRCFLRRLTRVAMRASKPTTLDGRMTVLAPGGRHPCNIYVRTHHSKS